MIRPNRADGPARAARSARPARVARRPRRALPPAVTFGVGALVLGGCTLVPGGGPGCRPLAEPVALPEDVPESSGVAVSVRHPGVYWTHDDGRVPWVFAVDADGRLIGKVRLEGATVRDAEDLALAACDAGTCLYLGDVGDNEGTRESVRVYRIPEPDPTKDSVATADRFEIRLPNGPRDVEAMFVLPGERLYLVSKGRHDAVTVYRYPGALRADTVTLEEVQKLSAGPRALPRQVTGASASPDGSVIAVRTYETVTFMRLTADTLEPIESGLLSLRTLREAQGEGVGIGPGGEVVVTSEAGPVAPVGSMARMRCKI